MVHQKQVTITSMSRTVLCNQRHAGHMWPASLFQVAHQAGKIFAFCVESEVQRQNLA